MIRKYISVICLNNTNGDLTPLYVIWDGYRKIPVVKVKEVHPSVTVGQGDTGLTYTCLFENNRIRHLYYDRGRWFVKMEKGYL